ncbi:MAG: thiamine phosphate synthase [Alphaproteobacteria bacterium]
MTLADIARILNSRARRGRGLPALLLLTDDARGPDPEQATARLPRGCGVVLRSYGLPESQRLALARRLATLCRRRGLRLLIAGDVGLAVAVGADGIHLPEGMARHGVLAPLLGWRRRRRGLLSVAAHGPAALWRAGALGADCALLSPVFPTSSHPGAPTIGTVRFAGWCRAAPVPVLALGGVRVDSARRLMDSGAAGLATVGGV